MALYSRFKNEIYSISPFSSNEIGGGMFLFRLRATGDNQMTDLCGNSFEKIFDGWHLTAGPFGTQDAFHVITSDAGNNGWFHCTALKNEALVKKYAGNFTITFWVKYDTVLTYEDYNGDAVVRFSDNTYTLAKNSIGIAKTSLYIENGKVSLKEQIQNGIWYFFEISNQNNVWYVFCNGQYLGSINSSLGKDFYLNPNTFYTGHGASNNNDDEFMGYLADFCVIGGQWHSPGSIYEKPTAYLTE